MKPMNYTVRFTLPGKAKWDFTVKATNTAEAILLAKVKAGRAKIPVLECKVEVL